MGRTSGGGAGIYTSPTTTRGDLIRRGISNDVRVPIGTRGQKLTSSEISVGSGTFDAIWGDPIEIDVRDWTGFLADTDWSTISSAIGAETDNTSYIASALAQAATYATHRGAIVRLPRGLIWTNEHRIKSGISLRGVGRNATRLKLNASRNTSFLGNYISSNGTSDPNGVMVDIRDMALDCNGDAQSNAYASGTYAHGIYFTKRVGASTPGFGLASGDPTDVGQDVKHLVDNVWIIRPRGSGVVHEGNSESRIQNVVVTNAICHGFVAGTDAFLDMVTADNCAWNGIHVNAPSCRIGVAKAFSCGHANSINSQMVATQMNGLYVTGGGLICNTFEAQDCYGHGIYLNAGDCIIGAVLDSNGYNNALNSGTFPSVSWLQYGGLFIGTNAGYSEVHAVSRDRFVDSVNATQQWAVKFASSTPKQLRIYMSHHGVDEGRGLRSVAAPVSGTFAAGNHLVVGSQEGIQELGNVSGTVNIDPYLGAKVYMTLTGTTTIANMTTNGTAKGGASGSDSATANSHTGLEVDLVIKQDGTGGRALSFGSNFSNIPFVQDLRANATQVLKLRMTSVGTWVLREPLPPVVWMQSTPATALTATGTFDQGPTILANQLKSGMLVEYEVEGTWFNHDGATATTFSVALNGGAAGSTAILTNSGVTGSLDANQGNTVARVWRAVFRLFILGTTGASATLEASAQVALSRSAGTVMLNSVRVGGGSAAPNTGTIDTTINHLLRVAVTLNNSLSTVQQRSATLRISAPGMGLA